MSRAATPLLVLLLSGCNSYDMFRLAGFQQETYSNKADLLFVLDNSSSMMEESVDLAENFDAFITNLADEQDRPSENLTDATNNYISFVQDRASFINYQIGITTTDGDADYGALKGEIVARGDQNVATTFTNDLLCNATCFCDPADAGCSINGKFDEQYLNDVCGEGNWSRTNCGSGQEEGLEAVFMALCRAVETPPESCFDSRNQFRQQDVGSNAGLLRDSATFIPVIITDEGDTSRRLSQGDYTPEAYDTLFKQFFRRTAWVVIGPDHDGDEDGLGFAAERTRGTDPRNSDTDGGGANDGDEVNAGANPLDSADDGGIENREHPNFPCPTGAVNWGTMRYEWVVEESRGLYIPITDTDKNCKTRDFADALEQVGQLLKSLLEAFPLQSVPQEDTLIVLVNGEQVERSTAETDILTGLVAYGPGWSYSEDDNSILFHGDAVPESAADVQIYYLPLDGMPRELPF